MPYFVASISVIDWVPAGRGPRVQLEGAVHHRDLVGVGELTERRLQPVKAQGTPWTGEVGPEIYLHALVNPAGEGLFPGLRRAIPPPPP